MFVRTTLEIEDIGRKVASRDFLPTTHAGGFILLLRDLSGNRLRGLLILVLTRDITADDLDLAYRRPQCLLSAIIQDPLLVGRRLAIGLLSLYAGIWPFELPLFTER